MQIFNNGRIPEQTRKAVNKFTELNRVPQSIMLTGSDEALKIKCANELAASVLCSSKNQDIPCGKCPSCKKALAGVHPDVTVIRPTENRKQVAIDDIREGVIEKLYIMPNEADNKVFILTGASDYSVYIQNALLKTIEEPPEDTMFIILCNQRNDMLETIISRATELYTGEAPDAKPKAKSNKANDVAASLMSAFASGSEYKMMVASAEIGKEREILSKSLEYMMQIIRDALVDNSDADRLSNHPDISENIARNYSCVALVKMKKLLDDISYRTDVNCNVALTTSLFTSESGRIIKEYYRK